MSDKPDHPGKKADPKGKKADPKGKKAPAKKNENCYFGCLPKDQVPKVIEGLKAALEKGSKTGDKKSLDFSIRGTKTEPTGISIESYSITPQLYTKFIDDSKDYMGKALHVVSLSIGAKDENSVKVLEDLLVKLTPMIKELPWMKKHPDKYQFFFRSSENRVFIDVINTEGKFLQPLLDLNINATDFHEFSGHFKTELKPGDLYDCKAEEMAEKFFKFVVEAKSTGKNSKYLLIATIEALKVIKLTDKKHQDKLNKILQYLSFLNAFVSAESKFEFDSKELCGTGFNIFGDNINGMLQALTMSMEQSCQNFLIPTLEQMQLMDAAKSADIDEISIVGVTPKYKNGGALVIKLPGFTKVFNDKFLTKK